MQVDINNLLTLPHVERKKIAEKLWNSLDQANSITKEDKDTINLLEKRWNLFEKGTSKSFTSAQLKKKIEIERKKDK